MQTNVSGGSIVVEFYMARFNPHIISLIASSAWWRRCDDRAYKVKLQVSGMSMWEDVDVLHDGQRWSVDNYRDFINFPTENVVYTPTQFNDLCHSVYSNLFKYVRFTASNCRNFKKS